MAKVVSNLFSQDIQPPKNSTQEVLYHLITNGSASITEFRFLPGFRTRISNLNLKFGLPMTSKNADCINKFGNKFRYVVHILENENLELAKSIYKKLQKDET